jgi:HK97 family phage major capsid protein
MDYKTLAEKALEERARLVGERRSVNDDANLSDAEKRERFERLDAAIDAKMDEARGYVAEGEREVRALHDRAGALGTAARSNDSNSTEVADEFNENLRAVALGERRDFTFGFSQGVVENFRAVIAKVSSAADNDNLGTSGTVTPDTFVAQLLESLEDTSDLVARVRKISTSTGEVMNWPRRNTKVGSTFQHVLEAANYPSVTDGDFSLFSLGAHKFGAIAEIPEEALTDPALNIGAIVAEEMGEDLAESLAGEILGGTVLTQNLKDATVLGTDIPLAVNSVAVYDALIDTQHALRQKYRRNASWTLSDDTERLVRKIKDLEDNYIWQPSVVAGQPDVLLGKPVATEALMPAKAASGLALFYGDLGRFYVLRNVRSVTVKRSDEFGFNRDTVALKITWRGDGGVTDPQALVKGSFSAT